jgi:hypothetical protein
MPAIHDQRVLDQRGAVAVFVVLGITTFVGAMALAVDLGMMMTARTEAQRTADAAALAGAASLIYAPLDEAQARQWAKSWALDNTVRRSDVVLRDQDIDVIPSERKVRVRVLRTADYGGPIATIFARLVGINEVDVAASAAAVASDLEVEAACLLPVAIPDRWVNGDSNPEFKSPPDIYWPPGHDRDRSGYGDRLGYRIGEEITLSPSQGGRSEKGGKGGAGPDDPLSTRLMPSWWAFWLPEGNHGVPPIRARIAGCVAGDPSYVAGDLIPPISGNKQSTAKAFEDLIDSNDEHLVWDGPQCKGVRDAPCGNPLEAFHIEDGAGRQIFPALSPNDPDYVSGLEPSRRYRAVPIFDPRYFEKHALFPIASISGVFVTRADAGPPGQRNIYGILLPWAGQGSSGETAGPNVLALRLVE